MNTRTMQRRQPYTKEIRRTAFRGSVLTRRDRDRANAARGMFRILKGVSADSVKGYVTPQELSALRSTEDGGCVGRLLNLLRALPDKRRAILALIKSEVEVMDMPAACNPLAQAFARLDVEEVADAADSIPQQEFNRNPCKQTSVPLRESLERHRDELNHAIDALKAFEEAEDAR